MLPVTMTSNCFGLRTSCMAQLSTYMCDQLDVAGTSAPPRSRRRARAGWSRARSPCRPSRACFARLRAASKPTCAMRRDLRSRCRASCRSLRARRRFCADALRLAEVDVAGELAHDQDVEPGHDLGLQRRGAGELRDRPAPGAGWRTGRAPCAGRGSPARAAWRAAALSYFGPPTAPNSIASAALRERRASPRAADRRARRRPAPPTGASSSSICSRRAPARRSTLQRLRDDLGADAVAGQDGDLHASRNTRGTASCAASSNALISSAWRSVRPISSRPFSRQCLRNGSMSKRMRLRAVGGRDRLLLADRRPA